ncbi:cholinesterase 1-like [Galleria mellonella]|uniref:Cholinesterase 1-like n=1 Tax=Galleria mellonella TaxID=7137 RepID=A0A6J1WX06_GALME|nr:cholinesterase 1-like [Galleria mellonella]
MIWKLLLITATLLSRSHSQQLNIDKDIHVRSTLADNTVSTDDTNSDIDTGNKNNDEHPDDEYDEVEIPGQGKVRGVHWKQDLDILGFIDIPYGKIEKLFQAPMPPVPWDLINNDEHNIMCPQLKGNSEIITNLDCLTLSIFKTINAENASVLFHIHDGNFTSGSGNPSLYEPEHLVNKGVILVLPNYRLGPLGFLCLQNETAPGNAGLKDLTFALNWTKENIELFGGNPSNIVVSGEGTAGALAQYLALSPKSRDYVSKVITDSGSVLSHWAIDRSPTETAEIFAEKLAELEDINDINLETLFLDTRNITFRPCVEKNEEGFITNSPWYILNNEKIYKTFMIGSANHAGLQEALNNDEHTFTQLNENFSMFLPNDLTFDKGQTEKDAVANKIRAQYFDNETISSDGLEKLSLYYTDANYLGPLVRLARSLVEAEATVYLYEFSFVGTLNSQLISLGRPIDGAARGDIIGYLFKEIDDIKVSKNPGKLNKIIKKDKIKKDDKIEDKIVDMVTKLWVNYIESGIPSAEEIEEWKTLSQTEQTEEEWLSLDINAEMQKGIHVDRLRLWTDIYKAHFVERNLAFVMHSPHTFLIAATISALSILPIFLIT